MVWDEPSFGDLLDDYLKSEEFSRKGLLRRYRPTVRVHDLRHSFASHLVSKGVGLQVVGKLLGHTQPSTTMRYAHLSDATNQFGKIFEFASRKRA